MEIDHITRLQRYKYAVQLHEQYERDDKAGIYNKLEKLWGKCNIAKIKGYAKKPCMREPTKYCSPTTANKCETAASAPTGPIRFHRPLYHKACLDTEQSPGSACPTTSSHSHKNSTFIYRVLLILLVQYMVIVVSAMCGLMHHYYIPSYSSPLLGPRPSNAPITASHSLLNYPDRHFNRHVPLIYPSVTASNGF